MKSDPAEMSNLIEDPEHAAALEENARLIGWNDATGIMFQ